MINKISILALMALSTSAFAASVPTGKSACVLSASYTLSDDPSNSVSCDGAAAVDLGTRKSDGNLSYWMSQLVSSGYQIKSVLRADGQYNTTYTIVATK